MGCPNCEYQIQRGYYVREVEREFKVGSPGLQADVTWPFDTMERALGIVSRAYFEYPKRPNPRWPVALMYGVEIYRNEVDKVRAADQHAMLEEARANRANRNTSRHEPADYADDGE